MTPATLPQGLAPFRARPARKLIRKPRLPRNLSGHASYPRQSFVCEWSLPCWRGSLQFRGSVPGVSSTTRNQSTWVRKTDSRRIWFRRAQGPHGLPGDLHPTKLAGAALAQDGEDSRDRLRRASRRRVYPRGRGRGRVRRQGSRGEVRFRANGDAGHREPGGGALATT